MSQIGPLLCPLLVGRDDLLQLVDRRIAEAGADRGHLLMLAGEAGIGKTRMLATALRKARSSGFRVAKGDLGPHDRQVPLASVLDLARTMRDDPAFGPLGRELLDLRGGQGGDSLGSRRLLVRDIADRIVATVQTPTVLAFEDLQWADELSLEVVGELARLAPERPLLLLAAYRLDELPVGSLHREWRSRLLSQRLAEEARLQRLSYDQTALVTTLILATGLPAPREVVNAVHERTNGIPLHIEELLAALSDEARTDGRAIRQAIVPDTIADAVLARAERLSQDARAVARAGAVIGRCFVPEVIAGVMDRPLVELEAPLEELVAASVLYPFDFLDRGFYDFRHQLLRDALYASVPAAELRRLHARAGEFGVLMEGASEIHASIHFERAGLRAQAYRTALAGARAASAISSRQEAFELFGRAVANVPDGLGALELAELYDAYSDAAFAVDNMPVSEETARQARRYFLEAGRLVEAAHQLVNLSGMARRDVQPPEERRRLLDQAEAELAALPDTPERSGVLSEVRELQAILELDALRLDSAAALADEADRLAAAAGAADGADLDFYLAWVDVLAGRVDDGLARMLRVAREARDANRESTGVTAYRVAAALAVRVMDYGAAEIGLREGMRYADAIEQSYCRRIMAATSAHVAWAAGRWDEAIPIAEIELVERGTRRGTLGSRHALGYVAFGQGQVDRARALLGESLEVGRASGEVELVLPPLWGLAETALVAGEPGVAIGHCEEALAIAEATGERALLVPFVVTGVRALLSDRRPDAAERWLARMTTLLEEWQDVARPALDHGEGLVRLATGSAVSARSALERAVRGWNDRGRVWEASWARVELARCLARSGRAAAALDLLGDARLNAVRLGSEPLLARIDEASRQVRGRSSDEESWRPLTPREFAVARLIADGLTNGEIATELGIASKTASAHVEHILAKLGLTRRAEVAAWASRITAPAPRGDARERVGAVREEELAIRR
jgi:DNA-binding CsgD family transcriptional regulator